MTLSSLGRVGTTDTNCTSNSNPQHSSSRSPSPSYDPLSERTGLIPVIQSHGLLSPDVQLVPAAQQDLSGRTSANSSAMNTPNPSRSTSPLPQFYSSTQSSASDTDSDEPVSPLLLDTYSPYSRAGPPRWWQRQRQRRGPRRSARWGFRPIVRVLRRVFRHPFFPKHPSTILLSLLFFSLLAVSITFLLIHLLNPDKEPLPWRAYCTVPEASTDPPPRNAHPTFLNISTVASSPPIPPFPPENFDSLPPAGVLVGVFSMDSSSERRMLIRSTWASHPRSRNGAGEGDGGAGTSRTVVRFIMGQPRKTWERRIRVEMEEYNDIVILPIAENMNSGKTHAFFTWAATMAWVPPLYFDTLIPPPVLSYANGSSPMFSLAPHDPVYAWRDRQSASSLAQDWVDDDSFIMLAELEARLRIALHDQRTESVDIHYQDNSSTSGSSAEPGRDTPLPSAQPARDPLIYWGYLVKRRFMAGEMYALSWSLVDWVSKEPAVKGLVNGAEDKQTAKWMRLHPRSAQVRWVAERCWIYDHPRSGTVYSHGFLFPSEADRVRQGVRAFFDRQPVPPTDQTTTTPSRYDRDWNAPAEWSRSTVSTFGNRYVLPLPNLTIPQSIEALVEGSDMSGLYEGSIWSAEDAWQLREGRKKRYNGQRLGGTVVVHFIKKHMWFFETVLALLEGEEETEYEMQRRVREGSPRARGIALSRIARHHIINLD
ncbi:glycosyltransferase family 31 protein [Lactarius psammicola]|nr:glycosyltransferase family 31 protein [Lactarius psammicola]